ncbi:response regulator [Exiguobacterium marinum]|uniref:response regulator n=2 Tax=Exiguobacterium marinum TaxID=273528 RepID=UPI00047888F5|nr:response regulator [Exiguobacterium marinum]
MANYLLVEPHEHTRKTLARLLTKEGEIIFEATEATDAIAILESSDIDVVITELRLPHTDGVELLSYVKKNFPLIHQIVLTDYTHTHTLIAAVNYGNIKRIMTKPMKIDEYVIRVIKDVGQQAINMKTNKYRVADVLTEFLDDLGHTYCLFYENGDLVSSENLVVPFGSGETDELKRFVIPTQYGDFILYQPRDRSSQTYG